MPDEFQFLESPLSKKWVIMAPHRAKRPNEIHGIEPVCPFCPGREKAEEELYRVGGYTGDDKWKILVIPNKYPFTPHHEIIIHSQDHHKGFDELPVSQTLLILQTYRQRYNAHREEGLVYIFHNHGMGAGESLPHPHSQVAVIPPQVKPEIPPLSESIEPEKLVETQNFAIFSPMECQWPDEVWIRPKKRGGVFGETTDEELTDLAKVLYRLVQLMDLRHGSEFPYNFYIYPGGDWYLRLIPRSKVLGGFELGTGIFVNTQDPKETNEFLQIHFKDPDLEQIKHEDQAKYRRGV